MDSPNSVQLEGLVRQVLLLVSGALTFAGFKNAATWQGILTSEAMIGVIMAVSTGVWGWFRRSNTSLVVQAAQTLQVTQVTVNDTVMAKKVAEAAPETKVVVKP